LRNQAHDIYLYKINHLAYSHGDNGRVSAKLESILLKEETRNLEHTVNSTIIKPIIESVMLLHIKITPTNRMM
jgi:hypothetical protein